MDATIHQFRAVNARLIKRHYHWVIIFGTANGEFINVPIFFKNSSVSFHSLSFPRHQLQLVRLHIGKAWWDMRAAWASTPEVPCSPRTISQPESAVLSKNWLPEYSCSCFWPKPELSLGSSLSGQRRHFCSASVPHASSSSPAKQPPDKSICNKRNIEWYYRENYTTHIIYFAHII